MDVKNYLNSLVQGVKKTREQIYAGVYTFLVAMRVPASVAAVIGELVTGVVMLFVGLFMLDAVYTATQLNNTSVFWGISVSLVSTTGTIFTVLGLVIIVVALATAIGSLKAMF